MKKKLTRNELLKHENRVLKASDLSTLSTAYKNIDKCSEKNYIGSAITITIKNINKTGYIIADEFSIADGLSDATIAAIKKDIEKSYNLKINHCLNCELTKKVMEKY